VRWGASRFGEAALCYGHGTDNPVDEALALALHALCLDPDVPESLLLGRLTREEKEHILSLFSQRISRRIPAAYLTGRAWFAGLAFGVDDRVLVPRSPIAELIEVGFEPWLDPQSIRRVLDVGTGSGCIAIASAVHLPDVRVDAVDISRDALDVARVNARDHGVADRVEFLVSNGLDAVRGPYDLIISNPPYVDARALQSLPEEYAHEPALGLAGGEDGLDVIARLIDDARRYLVDDGALIVEVGTSRAALESRYPRLPFTWLEFSRGGENVFLLNAADL